MTNTTVQIDIVSDVACPWCYIGKKRLENALAQAGIEAQVRFLPFQLDPSIPLEGKDRKQYFEDKFGSEARVESLFHRVEVAGHAVGVDFRFRDIPVMPNTLPLHILLAMAEKEGFQKALADLLFDSYMVTPVNLTDESVLVKLMETFGWSAEKTRTVLADKVLKDDVITQIRNSQRMGITGVPFFIINQQYSLSGAQPEEVWSQVLSTLKMPVSEADACDIDDPAC